MNRSKKIPEHVRCKSCDWCVALGPDDMGECRRNAPSGYDDEIIAGLRAGWPRVSLSRDWCGEHPHFTTAFAEVETSEIVCPEPLIDWPLLKPDRPTWVNPDFAREYAPWMLRS